MIIYFNQFDKVDKQTYAFLYSLLPPTRKQKVDRLFYEKDKQISIIEYFLVKKLLNFSKNLDFSYSEFHKPYIQGYNHFNISHSENMLVVCDCEKEVGIDVQKKIDYDDKLARYICSSEEYVSLQNASDKSMELTKLWTKKESFSKCKASSVFLNLKDCLKDCKHNFEFFYVDDFVICKCTK